MQTLGPLKLKKTGLEVRPAVFSEQTPNSREIARDFF